ncbi:chromate efflux transporter [Solimicrobium silvestre]|uniref:2A51: chromate transporter, chromate ion transporter (CHR) family n=1 Tax=Solimicrobium silvestre TaxID=2099400 RepID=A0A2S9GSM2_9BURK|nr:chromate efflux transporter [Solimicrobium silvestre]PRC90696.1 2A51: chromate transporter, chromate ion transporter (CHR) family [Solimicrobium silvestre]
MSSMPLERCWTIFLLFLRLGLTSFGGPVAHLGYFREEFVTRRRWLSESSYTDLVALCQFLPGPSSSQVGMAIGLLRGGATGALAAWAGFTLPSALMLCLFGMGLSTWGGAVPVGVLHGLKVVAVAVVAQAVWGMARQLCTGATRIAITLAAAGLVLFWPMPLGQVSVIVAAAVLGIVLFKPAQAVLHEPLPITISRRLALLLLGIFFALLIGLPICLEMWPNHLLAMVNAFYRAGALVFGGGHVVLPLLQSAVVSNGWVSNDTFLSGYGMTQAVPGPLFTFSAFLGASMNQSPNGWLCAALCLIAIFTPSFLLIFGVLPFWEQLRRSVHTQAALAGVNAAVVGLLLAALYHPVWTGAIMKLADLALLLAAFFALMFWRLPPWLVVLGCGVGGWLLS